MGRKKKGQVAKSTGAPHSYLKILAIFKCTGETCGKVWKSVHGWEREEEIYCEFCEKEAKVIDVKDEMLTLDNYECSCGTKWQSILDEKKPKQECYCGKMVAPSGNQERYGRHYTFRCTKKGCEVEWEDFSIEKQRGQRCGFPMCGNEGKIIGMQPLPSQSFQKRRPQSAEGSHRADCCDMCMDIIAQGKGRTCMSYRKVTCKLENNVEGNVSEKIIHVE
ncbi:hypothetical protein Ocin01_15936 [Orchesella cincta]|uniref:Uncharacterized protein n=1 Tax=Orchesella cincta TaxID=48709 RepID=A0A1D2MCL7_ORCCI|nr:hypothetical protein Ocin01_15936 [Orchesella cincta]